MWKKYLETPRCKNIDGLLNAINPLNLNEKNKHGFTWSDVPILWDLILSIRTKTLFHILDLVLSYAP